MWNFIGIFITNLAARDKSRRASALKTLQANFNNLLSISVPEDINEIVIGLPMSQLLEGTILDVSSQRNKELECNVSSCRISDKIRCRITTLAKHAEVCLSTNNIDATALQSKLTELVSKVCCYQ